MQTISGKIQKAKKIVMYGVEGVGKTVFGSNFPKPFFIDTEESTLELDVDRILPTCWAQVTMKVDEFIENQQGYETLIIDTADWAEQLAKQKICDEMQLNNIEDLGYGKGYVYLAKEIQSLLNKLTILNNKGMHVVILAHAMIKKFEQPDEAGAYDRYEMKLEKKTSPLYREWANMVLFGNHKTYVIEDKNKKKRAQDAGRVLYTEHSPSWDAKNRESFPTELKLLPDALPPELAKVLNFNTTKPAVEKPATKPAVEKPKVEEIKKEDPNTGEPTAFHAQLYSLMDESGITAEEIKKMVIIRGHFPEAMPIDNYPEDYVNGRLIANWDKVVNFINKKVRV